MIFFICVAIHFLSTVLVISQCLFYIELIYQINRFKTAVTIQE